METFERRFAETMSGSVLPMDAILRYVAEGKGKRLRPQLVFQCARLFGEINEATRRTALFVETVHTATLIHDDVVDRSDTRRGKASVNAQWGNVSAVLAGDYLLSKAVRLLSNPEDHRILKEMLDTTMAMSEGELLQLGAESSAEAASTYLDIITRKTALLFRSCCVGGAMSAGASQEVIDKVGAFGLNFGLVFQMRDDILDDDHPETTALAKKLLPEYKEKALKALDALTPFVANQDVLVSLKELTAFCAERLT